MLIISVCKQPHVNQSLPCLTWRWSINADREEQPPLNPQRTKNDMHNDPKKMMTCNQYVLCELQGDTVRFAIVLVSYHQTIHNWCTSPLWQTCKVFCLWVLFHENTVHVHCSLRGKLSDQISSHYMPVIPESPPPKYIFQKDNLQLFLNYYILLSSSWMVTVVVCGLKLIALSPVVKDTVKDSVPSTTLSPTMGIITVRLVLSALNVKTMVTDV